MPQDLAQAATELAAERFRAAERIGLRSKSLGGQETIAYDLSGDVGAGDGADCALSADGVLMLATRSTAPTRSTSDSPAFPPQLQARLEAKARDLADALADEGARRKAVGTGARTRSPAR